MKTFKLIIGLLITAAFANTLAAQTNLTTDSISLNNILNQVITNFPAIKKNQQELNAADARIGLAKTAYLPDVSFNANDTYLGPVSTISNIPSNGDITSAKKYPANIVNETIVKAAQRAAFDSLRIL